MTVEQAEPMKPTEPLRVTVELDVTHRVKVRIDGNSGQTMEELKQVALAEFHRDPNKHGHYGAVPERTDDTWRMQFNNRGEKISVGAEQVGIAAIKTTPQL